MKNQQIKDGFYRCRWNFLFAWGVFLLIYSTSIIYHSKYNINYIQENTAMVTTKILPQNNEENSDSIDEIAQKKPTVRFTQNYHRSCKGLFVNGTLVPPCVTSRTTQSRCASSMAEQWAPQGCKMKSYSRGDVIKCLSTFRSNKQRIIYIIGDSRERQIFQAMNRRILNGPQQKIKYGADIEFFSEEAGITVRYIYNQYPDTKLLRVLLKILEDKVPPIYIFLGNALHTIQLHRNKTPLEGIISYEKNLTGFTEVFNKLSKMTKVTWMIQATVHKDTRPVTSRVHFRAELVELYNEIAIKILKDSKITMIYSIRELGFATFDSYMDITHMGNTANDIITEMLLNYLCNNQWEDSNVQDKDEQICCSSQEKRLQLMPTSYQN